MKFDVTSFADKETKKKYLRIRLNNQGPDDAYDPDVLSNVGVIEYIPSPTKLADILTEVLNELLVLMDNVDV